MGQTKCVDNKCVVVGSTKCVNKEYVWFTKSTQVYLHQEACLAQNLTRWPQSIRVTLQMKGPYRQSLQAPAVFP